MKFESPPPIASLAAAVVIVWMTGCTLDFDEFETETEASPPDAGPDVDDDVAPPPDADVDADVNDHNDDPGPEGQIGADCESDDDCEIGVCKGAVCLSECDGHDDCPGEETSCFQLGDGNWCAPRCRDTGSCEHLEVNDELACTNVVETHEFGPSPHRLSRACLPDSADDGVFDGIDNCPDDINPAQRDATGDGLGDACADEPGCHADSSEGVLDYDDIEFRSGDFVIPPVADGRWLPVVGTVDAHGEPDSSLLMLDRHDGQWHEKAPLEFPGAGRFVVETNRGGFFVSPGDRSDGTSGLWTHISARGDVSYGPQFAPYDGDVVTTATPPLRFPNGEVQHLVVEEGLGGMGFAPDVAHLADLNAELEFVDARQVDPLMTDPGGFDELSTQTLRHADGTVGVALWHEESSTVHLIDVTAPDTAPQADARLHTLTIPDQWDPSEDDNGDNGEGNDDNGEGNDDNDVEEDDNGDNGEGNDDNGEGEEDVEDLSDFDPAFVPAPGGQLYVFDKNTGRAGRFLAERHEDAEADADVLFDREWGEFQRLPDYDLEDFQQFDDPAVYLLPDAPGFGLVGAPRDEENDDENDENNDDNDENDENNGDNDNGGNNDVANDDPGEDEPGVLMVREFYFHCHPITDGVDTAGDGVGEFVDNCPGVENPEQHDLDGDGWGDACDPDIDGDAIPNDLDEVQVDGETVDTSYDSNNNTIPNDEDDDTDGDGIPDQYDPFPLDSSNDGTPNRWTDDASGNGFTDDELRSVDRDPYNFSSLPANRQFVYAVEDDDGNRSLYRSYTDDPADVTELDLPEDVDPHRIFFGAGSNLFFLTGAPGETTRFMSYDIDQQTVNLSLELDETDPARSIRSLSWIDTSSTALYDQAEEIKTVVHTPPDDEDRWMISDVRPTTAGYERFEDHYEPVNAAFDHFWHAHLHRAEDEDVLFFIGAESDCRACAGAYYYWLDSERFEVLEQFGTGFEPVASDREAIAFGSLADPAGPLHHLGLGSSNAATTIETPAMFDAVFDIGLGDYLSGFEPDDDTPMALVTAGRYGQSADIWLQVPGADDWHLLVADEQPIREVTWKR